MISDAAFAKEIKEIQDDFWKARITLAISESRDEYGVIDPVQLERYLEMAMEKKG